MGAIASQITTLTMVYSTVYSGADFTCVYPKCSMYWWVIRKLCCYLCMNWIRVSDHIACFVKNVAYMLRLGVIYTVIYLIIFHYIHPIFFSMSVACFDCYTKIGSMLVNVGTNIYQQFPLCVGCISVRERQGSLNSILRLPLMYVALVCPDVIMPCITTNSTMPVWGKHNLSGWTRYWLYELWAHSLPKDVNTVVKAYNDTTIAHWHRDHCMIFRVRREWLWSIMVTCIP